MLTIKRNGLTGVVVALAALCMLFAASAGATTFSDRGAAILVWPKIVVDDANGVDTLLQLSNTDRVSRAAAHCFYVNANYHCTNTGDVCIPPGNECVDNGLRGGCVPGWIEVDFRVIITADQPLVWRASEGLRGSDLPCPSQNRPCQPPQGVPTAQTNAGTHIPPVAESPFIGELKCVQVTPGDFRPTNENDLIGNATVQRSLNGPDPAKYNAIGLRAEAQSADGVLQIGGADAEYGGCPSVLIVNHLFDNAEDPISSGDGGFSTRTELTLVPCSQDFLSQAINPVTAQFLVFNEFEQRFSTSRQVRCLLDSQMSLIDTSQPNRSIFSATVVGTIAGQTRITGVNGGLLGSALFNSGFGEAGVRYGLQPEGAAAYNIHQERGDRPAGDTIRIPLF
jgi:hypothetical protein